MSGNEGLEPSHTAPRRMAPRPVRQKCCPESSALRQGVQEGALTNAWRKSTPSEAMRSKFGVRITSLTVPGPSSFA